MIEHIRKFMARLKSERNLQIAVIVVILLILVVVGFSISSSGGKKEEPCKPQKELPALEMHTVMSLDGKHLATFEGYLDYWPMTEEPVSRYTQLKLLSINVIKGSEGKSFVILSFNCLELTFHVERTTDYQFSFDNVELAFEWPPVGSSSECVATRFKARVPQGEHYCDIGLSYTCDLVRDQVASVNMNHLEIEIDRPEGSRPSYISRGTSC